MENLGVGKDVTRLLFTPVEFGSITVKNRVVMALIVTNLASLDNEVTDRQITYYAERARGVIVEASTIHPDAHLSSRQIDSYSDRFIGGFARLPSAIKSQGAIPLLQLCHGGPKIYTKAGLRTESISPVGIRTGDVPRQLSVDELRQVRRSFVDAASRARKAGLDGVKGGDSLSVPDNIFT